jgi:1-deoxyxylulose-5-phosphate synthase
MDTRQLGRTGVEVSRVILGCGSFGGIGSAPAFFGAGESREEAFALMDAAWELGITTFDTADAYGGGRSETWIGEWMHSRGHRPVLITKTFNAMAEDEDRGLAPSRIERQIASSLGRLGVDGVDAYLAHAFDADTPLADSLGAFQTLAERGLIKAYGVSNFDGPQVRESVSHAAPAAVENSFSLLDRGDEAEVLPVCREHGVAYLAFSPLAGGWLAGRYRRGEEAPPGSRMATRPEPYEHLRDERTFAGLDALAAAAAEREVGTPALAVAWVLAQPGVTATIVGPRRPEHLDVVVDALELRLSAEEAKKVAELF